jgi:multidrug efflux pump
VFGYARLDEWEKRTRSQQEITAAIQPKLSRIAGLQAFASNPASLGAGRGGGRPLQYVVQSAGPTDELERVVDAIVDRMGENPGLINIDTDLKLNKPEIVLDIDRAKVADLGLDLSQVGRTLETLLAGRQVTRFERGGDQYDVMVQLAASDRASPETLSTIYLRAPSGEMIQLSNIVKLSETVSPKDLRRLNQLRAVTIQANLAPGYTLGEAVTYMDRMTAEVLQAGMQTDLSGLSRQFRESNQSLALVFVLALAFIFLVLAAQFESFIDPFIILLTVPLSMTGALLALHYSGGTLNVYSQIGLVTLVGLITKHGILIVEFANQRQDAGLDRMQAVLEAATLRLRPILMTTGAMVLGAIPLALAHGAGAESRQQIGWVIVGGMTLGTLLTLFVVPTAYTLLATRRHHHAAVADDPAAAPVHDVAAV